VATLDAWADVMKTNYYGCEVWPLPGYVTAAVLAAENRSLAKGEALCEPEPMPVTAYIYFHSFIILATLVLLSLFVGIMAIAMITVIHDIADESDAEAREAAQKRKTQTFDRLHVGSSRNDPTQLVLKERQKAFKICKALAVAIGGKFDDKFRNTEARAMEVRRSLAFSLTHSPAHSLTLPLHTLAQGKMGTCYVHFALLCRTISSSDIFSKFIALVICFAGVIVGLQADGYIEEIPVVEHTISGIFIAEACLKIIGEMRTPWHYFEDPWNRFDFFVILINFAIVR
jgi:hypothetical protein